MNFAQITSATAEEALAPICNRSLFCPSRPARFSWPLQSCSPAPPFPRLTADPARLSGLHRSNIARLLTLPRHPIEGPKHLKNVLEITEEGPCTKRRVFRQRNTAEYFYVSVAARGAWKAFGWWSPRRWATIPWRFTYLCWDIGSNHST